MFRRIFSAFGQLNFAVLIGALFVAGDAGAGFWKIDPILCKRANVQRGLNPCPSEYQCSHATVNSIGFEYWPDLNWKNTDYAVAYCPVPDTTSMGVASIAAYQISGFTGAQSGSAARGCIQFTNSTGEQCLTGYFPFPEGNFQGWAMPVPSNWGQWWHYAYTAIRMRAINSAIPTITLIKATN